MDRIMRGQVGVPDPGQHVSNGIGHHGQLTPRSTFRVRYSVPTELKPSLSWCAASLPTCFNNARDLTSKSQISKADPTHFELPEIATRSSTDAAAMIAAHLKFRL